MKVLIGIIHKSKYFRIDFLKKKLKIKKITGVASIAPDNDFFIEMASTYSNNHFDMHLNNRKCGEDQFDGGITNGAEWYNVPGLFF